MQTVLDGRMHPVRAVLEAQGRRQTWLAKQLGISANYLHRILLPGSHPDSRPVPDWFYGRVSAALGVPESMLRPKEEDLAAAL